jgi:hypothetical protein
MSGSSESLNLRRPAFAGSNFAKETLEAARAHPAFPQAARKQMLDFVGLYQGNRLLNTIVNDRGRVLVAYFCLYLHYFGVPDDPEPGLTVSRLKKVCADLGICSPGRAETMLILMRMFGHLEAAPATDRRKRLLMPTERLIESVRTRWAFQFENMMPVFPELRAPLSLINDRNFMLVLIRRLHDRFVAGLRIVDHAPGLELFIDRNAGIMVLFSLLLAGDSDDVFPPQRPVRLSISAVSRRFGVSRVHVRKLLRDATEQGYVARAGSADGEVQLLPPAIDAAFGFLTSTFLYLGHCAVMAADEVEKRPTAAA